MLINRTTIPLNKTVCFEDDIDYSHNEFNPNYLRGIPTCHAIIEATQYEDLLRLKIKAKAKVIGACCYTLEPVEININVNDEVDFTDDPDATDDTCEYEEDNIFSVDKYVLALILAKVPTKVVKKGAKLPTSGNGYRVLTEDELIKERSNKTDSRWDELDSLDFDN